MRDAAVLERDAAPAADPTPEPPRRARTPEHTLVAVVGVVLVATTAAVLRRAGGFSYTLDDPYIHLRIAQQIARGHYGMNPGEASAASSSALWPFLLAPFARWGIVAWVPLVIAGACTLVSARTIASIVRPGWRSVDRTGWGTAALAGLVVAASGTVAIAFTGLEHSLQIALSLAALLGVARVADGEAPPRWLWAVLAVLPLVRYEGLLVSGVCVVALVVLHQRRRALAALGVGVAGLAAFSGFLLALGLAPVPASILVKAGAADAGSGLPGMVSKVAGNWAFVLSMGDEVGIVLLATVALLAIALAAGAGTLRREVALLAVSAAVLVGHISVFAHGWFMRYEVYAMAMAMAAVVSSLPGVARAAVDRVAARDVRVAALGAALAVVAVSLLTGQPGLLWLLVALTVVLVPIVLATTRARSTLGLAAVAVVLVVAAGHPTYQHSAQVPTDAAALRHQQFQMHRFVAEYGRPVAANDIGWVTYDADVEILDLWGLASPEAHEARLAAEPGWMEDLLADRGVDVAVVYASWFAGSIPAEWTTVATLRTAPLGMVADDEVTIYARTPEAAAEARAALERLAPTLPDEVQLTLS